MKYSKLHSKPVCVVTVVSSVLLICTVEKKILTFRSNTLLLIPLISFGRLSPNILTADTNISYVFPLIIPVSMILEFTVVVFHGSLIL